MEVKLYFVGGWGVAAIMSGYNVRRMSNLSTYLTLLGAPNINVMGAIFGFLWISPYLMIFVSPVVIVESNYDFSSMFLNSKMQLRAKDWGKRSPLSLLFHSLGELVESRFLFSRSKWNVMFIYMIVFIR